MFTRLGVVCTPHTNSLILRCELPQIMDTGMIYNESLFTCCLLSAVLLTSSTVLAESKVISNFDEMYYTITNLAKEIPEYTEYNRNLLQHLRIPIYKAIAGCIELFETGEPFRGLFVIQEDLSYELMVKPRTNFTFCVSSTLPKLAPTVPMPPTTPFMNAFEYTH